MKTMARAADKQEILRRLSMVRPDSGRRWGRMSAHQMVCHLADAYRMAMGQKAVSPASNLLLRTLVKWMALYLPLKWRPGIVTRPEIDQQVDGTCPGDFASDVSDLVALVESVTATTRKFDWATHPIFGRMSNAAWLRWAYLHMDHHLRQFGC